MKIYQLYIGGQYVDPAKGEWFDSIDPYRGEPWAKIPRATAVDADRALKAANEAMWRGPWSKMTASARGKAMRKMGDLVAANAERLAEIEVRDNGKLMAEMLGQLRYHPEWWWYFGGLVDKLEGAWCRSISRKPSRTRRTSLWASSRHSRPGIRRSSLSHGSAPPRLPPAALSS